MFNIEGDHGFAQNQQRSNFKGSKNSSRNKIIDCRTQVLNLEKKHCWDSRDLGSEKAYQSKYQKDWDNSRLERVHVVVDVCAPLVDGIQVEAQLRVVVAAASSGTLRRLLRPLGEGEANSEDPLDAVEVDRIAVKVSLQLSGID